MNLDRLKPTLALLTTVSGLWLMWSGHYTPLILGFGVLSSVLVVLLCARMGILDRDLAPLHVAPAAVLYLPWLVWEVVKANIDVIRRVLHPGKARIEPRLLKLKASQKTDLGRITYANSITLTPGTVTIDAEGDQLTVHSLSQRGARALKHGRLNRRIARLEVVD